MKDDEVQVGQVVVLGRHTNNQNWDPDMDPYVGQKATIVRLGNADSFGYLGVRVDVDSGEWFWRVEGLTLLENVPATRAVGEAPVCVECGIPNEYAEVPPGEVYVCTICKSWRNAFA